MEGRDYFGGEKQHHYKSAADCAGQINGRRKKPVAFPVETTARFVIVIPEDEQAKTKFSEMGLVDTEGNFVAIKTMYVKQKDDDVEFSFTFDMEF